MFGYTIAEPVVSFDEYIVRCTAVKQDTRVDCNAWDAKLMACRGGGGGGWGSGDRSKSCPMPRFLKAGPTAPVICETVMRLFQKCPDALPCTRLAVAASDFEDGPLSEGQGSITKFFGAGSGKPT